MAKGVLSNLKVLDLSWGIAGPMVGMLLKDHGADVTRIERPEGDPFAGMVGYKVWHRGKKNAVFDLKNADDKALFLKLAADADVLIESFTPGVTDRLGIDYETLAAINPKLVYCSITGWGEGREQETAGYDALVAAKTGLQWEQRGWPEGSLYHIAGREDPFAEVVDIDPDWVQGANREGPLAVASPWPSLGAMFSAITGVSAALFAREKSGRGQKVSTSLHQGALACGSGVWQRAENPDAQGFNTWIMGAASPKGHFQCSDGKWIHNWVPNPRFILEASKGDAINATPDLTVQNDPDRFGIGPEELLVMAHYQPILADAVKKFPAADWVEAARDGGMTMQECRSLEESLTDPLLIDDGCVTSVQDEELGEVNQVGITFKLENSQGEVSEGTHASGADTDTVKAYASSLADPQSQNVPAEAAAAGPLNGVRVVDFGLAIAGPFGCQLLSDMGAEVIKVNTLWDGYWHRTHIAAMANRGKRSIALMLKHPKGMEALQKLVATADVLQHNMRYGAVERMGMDYASLKDTHPGLVYCHSRGFEDGPRKNLPGNDQTGACLAGVQHEDGALHTGEGHPVWSLTSLGDTGNGFLTATAICMALMEREKTGKGQFVDTSIVNACLLNTSYGVAMSDGSAVERPRLDAMQTGYGDHYRLYQCADGQWIQVAALTQKAQAALDQAAPDRNFAAKPADQWLAQLAEAGVPAALSDGKASRALFDRSDLRQSNWTVEYDYPDVGKLEQIGASYSLSSTPVAPQGPPLIVGDNSASLLAELGYCEEDIAAMAKENVTLCHPPLDGQQASANPWGL